MTLGNEGAPELGTSTNNEGSQEGNAFDFKQGYEQLRPEYTRATQEREQLRERLSEYEALFAAVQDDSDPETQRAAIEALGLDVDTGAPVANSQADEWQDPLEQEVMSLREWKEKVEQERELEASQRADQSLIQARDEYIDEALGYIEENLKRTYGKDFKFKESELEVLGNLAIAMEDEEGIPDVQGAYERVYGGEGVLETNRARWIETKQAAQLPPLGTSIPADKRPKTPGERMHYIDERVRALESQQ